MKRTQKPIFLILCFFCAMQAEGQSSIDYDAWKNASEVNPYNVTNLLVNATGTGNTGWSRNNADAAAGYNKHNTEFASSVYDDTGIESWYWSPVKSADLIWQDVQGLLPGTYRVRAYAVAQIYNNNSRKGQCGKGAYLFAGNEKVAITSNKWQELTLTATVDDSQTLRIGICGDEGNENDWVSIAQVKLECLGFAGFVNVAKIVLDDRYDVSVARESGIFDVVFHVTLSAHHTNAFCVPFSMNADEVGKYFSEVREVIGASPNNEAYTLATQVSTVIKAGTPYIVKAKVDGRQTINLSEVAVTPLNSAQPTLKTFGTLKLVGSYRSHENISGAYVLSEDGKSLVKASDVIKVRGYKFYGQK